MIEAREAERKAAKGWTCEMCTVVNNPDSIPICQTCGAQRQ